MDLLKKQRGGHRAYVSKLCKEIYTIADINILKSRLLMLKEKKGILESFNLQIVQLMENEDEINTEVMGSSDFTQSIMEATIFIEGKLQSEECPRDSKESIHLETANSVKLPKLVIKPFAGNPLLFSSFWDIFNSAIHMNKSIDDITKFTYLKGLLQEEAEEAVSGLAITSENYISAVEILKKRFGDPQVIINANINSLLSIPPVTSIDGTILRQFTDKLEVHTRNLSSFGIDIKQYGPVLISMIMAKLPNNIKLEITRKMPMGNMWNITDFINHLKNEVSSREKCYGQVNLSSESGFCPAEWEGPKYSGTSTLLAQGGSIICPFCNGGHTPSRCNIVTDIQARKDIIGKSGKCFNCLKSAHVAKNCSSTYRCFGCSAKHHISLCGSKKYTTDANVNVASIMDTKSGTLLQSAKANIYESGRFQDNEFVEGRVLFDNCSQKTFIKEDICRKLNMTPIRKDLISVSTFGTHKWDKKQMDVVKIIVKSKISNFFVEIEACVVPYLCAPIYGQNTMGSGFEYAHLEGLTLADYNDGSPLEVDILIGADNYWEFFSGKIKKGANGPVALENGLGWLLSGNRMDKLSKKIYSVNFCGVHQMDSMIDIYESSDISKTKFDGFWERENVMDFTYNRDFFKNISFNGTRYEVTLPWKNNNETLPDNYQIAKSRMISVFSRLKNDERKLAEYNRIMLDQEEQDIIESVDAIEEVKVGEVHYLPHHGVTKEDKLTSKLRIVFDASAKRDGPSLNDCMEKGPNLIPLIFNILSRFRTYKVALVGDIKQAFLNIGIVKEDRDFLRFLWIEDVQSNKPNIVIKRFKRLLFGLNASPNLLVSTVIKHLEQYKDEDPLFVTKFLHDIYVDDLVSGDNDMESAFAFYLKSKMCMLEGAFNIRKWWSNEPELMKKIRNYENALVDSDEKEDFLTAPQVSKILGLLWCSESDVIQVDLSTLIEDRAFSINTKRQVLSCIAMVYDPLGLVTPVMLDFKLFFRDLCSHKIGWDEKLLPVFLDKWKILLCRIQKCHVFTFPRYYFGNFCLRDVNKIFIHGFSDASVKAYAAVIYVIGISKGKAIGGIVASKTRISPAKNYSIPKLELLGCVLLSKLIKSVLNSLRLNINVESIYCWTDALDCLHWIKNTSKLWKPFIQKRVKIIREITPIMLWKFCPGTLNPADLPSRGNPLTIKQSLKLWQSGPEFIYDGKFPKDLSCDEGVPILSDHLIDEEESQLILKVSVMQHSSIGNVVDIERYSSLNKLLRISAYVFAFVKLLNERSTFTNITLDMINHVRSLWIKDCQFHFSMDGKYWNHLKYSLGVYLDKEGIIRCKGRIDKNVSLSFQTKHPILLPKSGKFVELIVKEAHLKTKHGGIKDTLTELRSMYWIPCGRQVIRSFIFSCVVCKKIEGKPYKLPIQPDLPDFRVDYTYAFQSTGVDYMGPVLVRQVFQQHDYDTYNVHIVLYTCASTRAIHLDIVPDPSASAFIRSLKRFIGRRGLPSLMISDNATCFKNEELRLSEELLTLGIQWKFIVEAAPWWGGFWERLVGSVKRSLHKVIINSLVSYEELLTILVEIEVVINCRPLTYLYSDDCDEILTPSHLLNGRRILADKSKFLESNENETQVTLTRRMKFLNDLLSHFWGRWKDEYLVELREKHFHGKNERSVKLGDMVIIEMNNLKRNRWPLGKVVQLLCGNDQIPRAAVLKIHHTQERFKFIKRAISKLIPLEINANIELCENDVPNSNNDLGLDDDGNVSDDGDSTSSSFRPRRAAADTGILKRQLNPFDVTF